MSGKSLDILYTLWSVMMEVIISRQGKVERFLQRPERILAIRSMKVSSGTTVPSI
jgi:hypothetical protein